jgi:hypothetical protein
MSNTLDCALAALGAALAATPATSIQAFLGALSDVLNLLARSSGRGQRGDLRSLAVCLSATLSIAEVERTRNDGDVDLILAAAEADRISYELDCEQADLEAAARAQLGVDWRREIEQAEILTEPHLRCLLSCARDLTEAS